MASLKDIKRRIGSVKSTQKITNAMKLVSASKFARASHAVQSARPYGQSFDQMVQKVVSGLSEGVRSSLMESREEKRSLFIVVGSDRGLCGGFNANLFKKSKEVIEQKKSEGIDVTLWGWGRRPSLFCQSMGLPTLPGLEKVLVNPQYSKSMELANKVMSHFESDFDRVYLCYPRFKSAIEQIPVAQLLLPVKPVDNTIESSNCSDVIVEPSGEKMLTSLLEQLIRSQIHRTLLESAASEHGARMSAMDSATNNAKEVQKKLTLQYNRARQAAITKELMEIIGGAEALN